MTIDPNDSRLFRATVSDAFTGATDDLASSCAGAGAVDRVFRVYNSARGDFLAQATTSTGSPLPVSIRSPCTNELTCDATAAGATLLTAAAGYTDFVVEAAASAPPGFTLSITFRVLPFGDLCENSTSTTGWGCTAPNFQPNPNCGQLYQRELTNFSGYRQNSVPSCGMAGVDRTFAFDLEGEAGVTVRAASTAYLSVELFGPLDGGRPSCAPAQSLGCTQGTIATVSGTFPPGSYRATVTVYGQPVSDAGLDFQLQRTRYRYDRCQFLSSNDRLVLDGGSGRFVGSNFGFDNDNQASCASQQGAADSFHPIAVQHGQTLRASVRAIGWDPVLQLWAPAPNGCDSTSTFALACNAGYSFAPAAIQTGPLDAGVYTLQVDGRWNDDSGPYELDVSLQ